MGPQLGGVAGSPPRPALLADANVLIDYQHSDLDLLALVGERVAPIFVLTSILQEVDDLSEEDCRGLGIRVIEATTEELLRAQQHPLRAHLNDRLCFVVAESRGFVCLTNDGKLRRYCRKQGVPTRYGLSLVVDLVADDALPLRRAEAVAEALRASNDRYLTREVLSGFLAAVRAASARDESGSESEGVSTREE